MNPGKEIEIFNGRAVCPRCNGNGTIYKVIVVDLHLELYVCDECEASWKDRNLISVESFEDFSTFLEKNGCTYKDAKVIDLGYSWVDDVGK